MKNIYFISLFLLATGLFAQNQGGIKGKVFNTTMDNEPLLMANVQIKGQEAVSQTNFNGNFEILNLSAGKYILLVSYLGFETLELPVTIKENVVSNIVANLKVLQFDLRDVVGLDSASTEEDFPTATEKGPRK